MGSQQDNLNNPYYKSPYARQSYPSTEEGFIPLSFSSPYKAEQGHRQRGTGTPYHQQNWHNYRKKGPLSNHQRDFSSHSSRPSCGSDWDPNQSGERKFYKKPSWSSDISDYIHPTTFEDPWRELVERQQALGGCGLEEENTSNKTAGEGTSEQEEKSAEKTSSDLEEQSIDKSASESACGSEEQIADKSNDEDDTSGGNLEKDK